MDRKKFTKLYNSLPKSLQKVISSKELGDNLEDICTKFEILNSLYEINDFVGDVLLGLLPPNEFQKKIENELDLKKEKAKKITREINRYIFYPVKSSLEDVYNIEIAPAARMKIKPSMKNKVIRKEKKEEPKEKNIEKKKKEEPKEKDKKKKVKDTYREPIEE